MTGPVVRKSVLFAGAFPRPAALDRFVSGDLAGRLQTRGWRTEITSRQPGRLLRVADLLLGTWRARTRCDVACVDVFSGAAFWWAEAAVAILRRARKPCVLILHGGNLPDFTAQNPSRVKALLASATVVVSPSHYLASKLRHLRPDVVVIPNGFDVTKYTFRLRTPPLRRLLWLRAFHAIYNPAMAPEVLALVRRRLPDTTLTMAGPDKGDGSLQETRKRVQELGVAKEIAFPGPVPKEQIPALIAAHDLFINTTRIDNTPVSLIEAAACGLPIISTNVGGIPYLFEDMKSGLLVDPGQPKAMAAAVARLMDEPQLGCELSRNGRQLVESFDWNVVVPQWEALLANVAVGLHARANPPCDQPH